MKNKDKITYKLQWKLLKDTIRFQMKKIQNVF